MNVEVSEMPQMLGDRVLIDHIKPTSKLSDTGLVKAVNTKENWLLGKIMSIADGEYGTPVPDKLKVGDVVAYYNSLNFFEIEVEKKIYHCIRVSDIFMIPTEEMIEKYKAE